MRPRLARVRSTRRELDDTVSLELEAADGTLPCFAPGQFHMLYAFGVGEAAISISGARGDGRLHAIRAVGPVSRALAALAPGAMLGVRGPFGHGWPLERARGRDLLLIAGGLGLAPLRPALEAALAARAQYGRITLLTGARSPAQQLWAEDLRAWAALPGVRVECTVDRADAAWRGHVGVVTALLDTIDLAPARSVAMLCGPEPMMRACAGALRAAGLADRDIHASMERNMQCGIGLCGHCQLGPAFVCRDGPVMSLQRLAGLLPWPQI